MIYLIGSIFNLEDEDIMFFRNVAETLPDYTALRYSSCVEDFHHKVQWRILVKAVMNLLVPYSYMAGNL
jgi:hypothetical protein